MNRQITRLAATGVVLIVAVIVATTYWQTWAVAGLNDRQDNAVRRVAEFTIDRGVIRTRDGGILARNVKRRRDGKTLFFRTYPQRALAPHAIGYATQFRDRTGLEQSENAYLTASNANLGTVVDTALDRLRGSTIRGNDVVVTLKLGAQRLANRLLGTRCGAVVALDVRTGGVAVLASSPTYDPNLVDEPGGWAAINRRRGQCNGASALYNRATLGLYPPGSTFKVVTAAAALDTGRFTPDSPFYDPGYCEEYGQRVRNAGNPEAPETFGAVTLSLGLQHSINSVFCNVGKALGAAKVLEYAKRFGFYSRLPLDTPPGERAPSGLYNRGELFDPKDPASAVDPGRLAFGQERLLASPLQMALVAATVGSGGRPMRPRLVDRVVDPSGKTVKRNRPERLPRVLKRQTAEELTAMMVASVRAGTGTSAQIPGIDVAGKTGTAETGRGNIYTAWFVAFAPADRPRYAIAVVVENQPGGFGGKVSAPIAREVLQALLPRASKR